MCAVKERLLADIDACIARHADRRMAHALCTKPHTVDPRLAPPRVRKPGMALLRRFERTGQPADLDEAIKVSQGTWVGFSHGS